MILLPVENIILKSSLSEYDLKRNLLNNLEPWKAYRFFFSSSKIFEGEIINDHFKINRITGQRNYIAPKINGYIKDLKDHREIGIKMTLNPFAILILIVTFVALLGFSYMGLVQNSAHYEFNLDHLGPLGIVGFMYLFMLVFFKYECYIAKNYLKQIFKAD